MPARTKITPTVKTEIIGALRVGADIAKVAAAHHVTRQAIYKQRRQDPEFAEAMDDARAEADDNVVQALYDSAIAGNVTSMIFWLKNRRPAEWRDRHEIAVEDKSSDGVYQSEFDTGESLHPPTPEGLPN